MRWVYQSFLYSKQLPVLPWWHLIFLLINTSVHFKKNVHNVWWSKGILFLCATWCNYSIPTDKQVAMGVWCIRVVVIYVAIHCKHACFLNLCMTSNGSNASEYVTEKGGEWWWTNRRLRTKRGDLFPSAMLWLDDTAAVGRREGGASVQ